MSAFEKYIHHHEEKPVWVRKILKGRHREHCLCHSCKKFHPEDREENCDLANKVFKLCVEEELVLPVWECSKFDEQEVNGG